MCNTEFSAEGSTTCGQRFVEEKVPAVLGGIDVFGNAIDTLGDNGIPYIVVLTDPTSGGVFASFASLGDIILAEPKAYIGFAGARLIEGALRVKLPEGFQRAEYQFENGFIDRIVPRAELRPFLGKLLRYLSPEVRATAVAQ